MVPRLPTSLLSNISIRIVQEYGKFLDFLCLHVCPSKVTIFPMLLETSCKLCSVFFTDR